MVEPGPAEPFEDFPLQPEFEVAAKSAEREPDVAGADTAVRAAPLVPRFSAAAADAAVVLLLAALALLGARWWTGAIPRRAGAPWTLAFLLYLSLFATVPPLVLFGKTVGMAISDLSARSGGEAGLTAGGALRRWAGTLACAATAGLILLWSRRDPARPTPADRLSGRPLTLD